MKNKILKWLLFAFTFIFMIYMGGGLFEAVTIVPVWSASVEAARAWNSNPLSAIETARFFIPVSASSLLLGIATLALGWSSPRPMRFWLRLGLIMFLLMSVATFAYFVPEQLAIKGASAARFTDAELAPRLSRWASMNIFRAFYSFVMIFAMLKALSSSRVLEEQ
jgi:succinate dehydrogenase hydrophobic anchor subunit